MAIRGVLFDKDGTLFDFQRSWGRWASGALRQLAAGDAEVFSALATATGFDHETERFHPDSLVIAGTHDEAVGAVAEVLHWRDPASVYDEMTALAAEITAVEAVPLAGYFDALRRDGYRLGVATNDAEALARIHLAAHLHRLEFLAGYDSGHGAKPAPGMVRAFAESLALAPEETVMVGDSRHDLEAGRAAGARTVAVLTGVASERELAPHADVVLPDIGALPQVLTRL